MPEVASEAPLPSTMPMPAKRSVELRARAKTSSMPRCAISTARSSAELRQNGTGST